MILHDFIWCMLWCWHVFVRVCDVFIRSSLSCKDWIKLGSPWPKTRQCRIERQDVVEDRATRCLKMFGKRHEVFACICPKHACHINIGWVLKCYQRISAWFYLYRLYLLLVWSWRESLPQGMHEDVEFTLVRNASPAVHCSSSSWSPGAMKRADAHSLAMSCYVLLAAVQASF